MKVTIIQSENQRKGLRLKDLSQPEPFFDLKPGQIFGISISGYIYGDISYLDELELPRFFKCIEYIPGNNSFFKGYVPQQYIIEDNKGNRFRLLEPYRLSGVTSEDRLLYQVNHSIFPKIRKEFWDRNTSYVSVTTFSDNLELKDVMESTKANIERSRREHANSIKEQQEREKAEKLAKEAYQRKVDAVTNDKIDDLFTNM